MVKVQNLGHCVAIFISTKRNLLLRHVHSENGMKLPSQLPSTISVKRRICLNSVVWSLFQEEN